MRDNKKHLTFAITMTVISIGLMEAASYSGLWWLKNFKDIDYVPLKFKTLPPHYHNTLIDIANGTAQTIRYSQTLGWEPKGNVSVDNFWYRGSYTTNSIGIRHNKEITDIPGTIVTRIVTFGESYTEGGEVPDDATWQAQLSATDPNIETLNFGVSGYGMDQAYLRYVEQGEALNEDIAIIGYMTENLRRSVNTYIPFYVGENAAAPVSKPRFKTHEGRLKLIANPTPSANAYLDLLQNPQQTLARLGEHDFYFNSKPKHSAWDVFATVKLFKLGYYQIKSFSKQADDYHPDSEFFTVTTGILDAFHKHAIQNDSVPLILIYPSYNDLTNFYIHKVRAYQSLIDWLEVGNYAYLDLMQPMLELGKEHDIAKFFVQGVGHYSAFGNGLVAQAVQQYITKNELTDAVTRESYLAGLSTR